MQRNHYLDCRLHIQQFRRSIVDQLNRSTEENQSELREKYRTLLAFDFEASVRLQQWSSLSEIVQESRTIGDEKLYGIFADAIFCSEAPVYEISPVFQVGFDELRFKFIRNISNLKLLDDPTCCTGADYSRS